MRPRHPIASLALASLCLLLVRSQTNGEEPPPFRIGFSTSTFSEVNHNDASAAVKVWARSPASERHIAADPQPRILQNLGAIAEALTNRLVDAVNLTTQEYFLLREQVVLEDLVIQIKAGRDTEEYLLLVHNDAGIRSLADLKGHTLTLLKSPRTSLAHAWLDCFLVEQGHPRSEEFFSSSTEMPGLTKVVLSVFFRKTDACLVTRNGFDTMIELNPQTGRQLKVLAVSPPLIPNLFGFRGDYVSPIRTEILGEIARWHASPSGKQILNLFQCDRLEERPKSVLEPTLELIARHSRICRPHLSSQAAVPNPANLTTRPGQTLPSGTQ